MTRSTNYPLPYGLARLQARVGDLPTVAEWSRLRSLEGFGPFLEAARKTSLTRSLTTRLDSCSDSHEIERQFRHSLGRQIEELTGWLPPCWHPGLNWLGLLPYLEIFAHLRRDGVVYPWMREDMRLFRHLGQPHATPQSAPEAPTFEALPGNWETGWYHRLPRGPLRDRVTREKFAPLLLLAAGLANDGATDGAWEFDQRLRARLLRVFHRHCTSPLAAFAYLALILIETRLLRSELQRRLFFPVRGVGS